MKMFVSLIALAGAIASTPARAETPAEVDRWIAGADRAYFDQTVRQGRADWVYQTYVTDDSADVAAQIGAATTRLQVANAARAAELARVPGLAPETRRLLTMFRTAITAPAPTTPGAAEEFARLSAKVQGLYAKGQGTLAGQPINGSDIEAAMVTNRDPAQLREMWTSWHDNVGPAMKADYARMVEISNAGARELGFADTGALWRSNYDMDPDEFAALTETIWNEVKPLYRQLHCYTRSRLNARYGEAVQPAAGPIRADLLGNMWAQEWGGIYDIVAPPGAGDIGYDIGALLTAKGYDPLRMVRTGEAFYSSLGFTALPQSFWERSQFVKPRDREVVCHASAWDIDNRDDLRIKMCTKVNANDFITIHHELGHNYYQRAYSRQPYRLYMEGANDGFHEAIGDTMALAITPDYLVRIGLLDPGQVPPPDRDIGLLLRQAMDKVAFLPFGLLIDRWRWKVFSGEVAPADYQSAWDAMRREYQGVVPPAPRQAAAFDPGAKYHIPAVVPYTRYFLARVLQFQFYEAACRQAGWKGPLHRCSFYGDKRVGERLNAMLAMGASKPWPDALETFAGSRRMSGEALLRYFAPLSRWLAEQNRGKNCGW